MCKLNEEIHKCTQKILLNCACVHGRVSVVRLSFPGLPNYLSLTQYVTHVHKTSRQSAHPTWSVKDIRFFTIVNMCACVGEQKHTVNILIAPLLSSHDDNRPPLELARWAGTPTSWARTMTENKDHDRQTQTNDIWWYVELNSQLAS